jgi:hypothetical protein
VTRIGLWRYLGIAAGDRAEHPVVELQVKRRLNPENQRGRGGSCASLSPALSLDSDKGRKGTESDKEKRLDEDFANVTCVRDLLDIVAAANSASQVPTLK